MSTLIEWLSKLGDILANIDTKIGFSKFKRYIYFLLFIVAILNIETIFTGIVNFSLETAEKIHYEKMKLRDELMSNLLPVLIEYRSTTKADRLFYFEYHNTKENILGTPFKYFELMLQDTKYGVPRVDQSLFREQNTGYITPLYNDFKYGRIIGCSGHTDQSFRDKYPGVFELFNQKDESKQQVFISVPGIDQPVGFIILEWIDDTKPIDLLAIEECTDKFLPRINALILMK